MALTTSSGTFSTINDMLSIIHSLLSSDGWTINQYSAVSGGGGTYRLHVSKVYGSTTYYFNFRTSITEDLLGGGILTGIFANQSTGYDSASLAEYQPGAPNFGVYGAGGGVTMGSSAGSYGYYFVSDDDHTSFFIEDYNGDLKPIIMSIGPNGGALLSSYSYTSFYGDNTDGNSFLRLRGDSQYIVNYGCPIRIGSDFYQQRAGVSTRPGVGDHSGVFREPYGPYGLVYDIWNNSPNQNIGIPVLTPLSLTRPTSTLASITSGEVAVYDDIQGIKIVNATYLDAEDVLTVGGHNYRVFTPSDTPSEGIAVKITE